MPEFCIFFRGQTCNHDSCYYIPALSVIRKSSKLKFKTNRTEAYRISTAEGISGPTSHTLQRAAHQCSPTRRLG